MFNITAMLLWHFTTISVGFCQVELILRCFEMQKNWLPFFLCQSLLLGTNVLVDNCAWKSAFFKSSQIFENLRLLPYKGASFIISLTALSTRILHLVKMLSTRDQSIMITWSYLQYTINSTTQAWFIMIPLILQYGNALEEW